jgi:hypothetical protein
VDVRGPVHAEWFGAVGDDPSKNDAVGIQACLSAFGRVNLLAKKYYLQQAIALKQGNLVAGAGIDKTTLVDKRAGGSGGAAAISVFESGSPAPGGAVIQDLTVDCAFNETWSQRYASRQAIALTAPDVIVRRVKAIKFGAGSSGTECKVIALDVANADERLGTVQDCLITQPGDNSAVTYSGTVPLIICLALGPRGATGWKGRGGLVIGNRITDLPYTGATGAQRSPLRGVCFGGCLGARIAENEIVNFDGAAVWSEVGEDEDVEVEENRLIEVNIGVYLAGAAGPTHSSTGLRIRGNLVVLGKASTSSVVWQGRLYGIWCQFAESIYSFLKDCWVRHNFVGGTTVDGNIPVGVKIEDMAVSTLSGYHLDDNVLELPDAAASGSAGFGVAYENAIVYSPSIVTPASKLDLHGNRNLAGADLRAKLLSDTSRFWGSFSTRLARFQAPAFDGRVGLATDDFVGQLSTGFALGWTTSSSGWGSVVSQNGLEGHPGIVLVNITSSSSTLSSALLRYGFNGIVLGPSLNQTVEFAAKRTGVATQADNYECRLGLMKTIGDDGVYFKVLWANNSNYIFAVAASGANSSSSSTGNDTTPGWHVYRIETGPNPADPQQQEVRFYVDGQYLCTMPSSCLPTTPLQAAFKVAALTTTVADRGLLVDYFQHQVTPT